MCSATPMTVSSFPTCGQSPHAQPRPGSGGGASPLAAGLYRSEILTTLFVSRSCTDRLVRSLQGKESESRLSLHRVVIRSQHISAEVGLSGGPPASA